MQIQMNLENESREPEDKTMPLETDPEKTAKLAEQKEDANWRLRCRIKRSDLSIEEIDAIVHRLYRTIAEQIDCRRCANCCKAISPLLQPDECKRLAEHLDLSTEQFIGDYLVETEDEDGYLFKPGPCPFLSDDSCTIYDLRPEDCRSYPHLHKDKFVFRVSQAFANTFVCPIVYNVFEALRKEIRR